MIVSSYTCLTTYSNVCLLSLFPPHQFPSHARRAASVCAVRDGLLRFREAEPPRRRDDEADGRFFRNKKRFLRHRRRDRRGGPQRVPPGRASTSPRRRLENKKTSDPGARERSRRPRLRRVRRLARVRVTPRERRRNARVRASRVRSPRGLFPARGRAVAPGSRRGGRRRADVRRRDSVWPVFANDFRRRASARFGGPQRGGVVVRVRGVRSRRGRRGRPPRRREEVPGGV